MWTILFLYTTPKEQVLIFCIAANPNTNTNGESLCTNHTKKLPNDNSSNYNELRFIIWYN